MAPERRGLRTGFTTGACAAAATRGACLALAGRGSPFVDVPLPAGFTARFALAALDLEPDGRRARASVVKDAGDDPDVTHGAEITAAVELLADAPAGLGAEWAVSGEGAVARRLRSGAAIELWAADGVGTVTRPGLGLPVGGPAINPVPRRMIARAVRESLADLPPLVRVGVGVRDGERLALRTLNGRLGIAGGLSILGTTGVVRPYSTAAWRASVLQGVDVAAAAGCAEIVGSTGGRSEAYARALLPDLPQVAFVELGPFAGALLRRAGERGMAVVWLAGMIGKLSRIARGRLMTHSAGGAVDLRHLAGVARRAGAGAALAAEVAAAGTARRAQELVLGAGLRGFFDLLAADAVGACRGVVGPRPEVRVLLFDFDGTLLGACPAAAR